MIDLDLRALVAGLGLAVLAALALAAHARAWRADREAFGQRAGRAAPYAARARAAALRVTAIACLALAAAAPAWRTPRTGTETDPTLVVVLDVSMSMRAGDLAPTRLDEARRQIAAGLAAPAAGRLALVAFAAAPTLVCPPTTDRVAFGDLLAATREDAATPGPSQASAAVARAIALVGRDGGDVLLVSDGEFPDADRRQLQEVAEDAVRRGVRISTIGVGTDAGAPLPVRDGAPGQVQRDATLQPMITRRDEPLLRWLAGEGRGQYVPLVAGGEVDLVALTERLRLAGDTTPRALFPFGPVSLFGYPLALGVALLVLDAALAWRRRRG